MAGPSPRAHCYTWPITVPGTLSITLFNSSFIRIEALKKILTCMIGIFPDSSLGNYALSLFNLVHTLRWVVAHFIAPVREPLERSERNEVRNYESGKAG